MAHPESVPALTSALAALDVLSVPEAARPSVAAAKTAGSIVPACNLLVQALGPHAATLALAPARVLAGAAQLMAANNWTKQAPLAGPIRDAAIARVATLEA